MIRMSPERAGFPGPPGEKLWCVTMPPAELLGCEATAGDRAAMVRLVAAPAPLLLVTTAGCEPAGASTGTCAVIEVGDTKRIAAFLPPMVSFEPSNEDGSVLPRQPLRSSVTFARVVPDILMRPPGADAGPSAALPLREPAGRAGFARGSCALTPPPGFTVVCRFTE